MPDDLIPGHRVVSRPRAASASYRGVLRATRGSHPKWACEHYHPSPVMAKACAERELERRGQGGKEVFTLLRCEPCSRWWDDVPDVGSLACPVCGVPMERLKLVVTQRGPAS